MSTMTNVDALTRTLELLAVPASETANVTALLTAAHELDSGMVTAALLQAYQAGVERLIEKYSVESNDADEW